MVDLDGDLVRLDAALVAYVDKMSDAQCLACISRLKSDEAGLEELLSLAKDFDCPSWRSI